MALESLLVCAIDFGTTFSGWAFSFKSDFKTDPTRASIKHWRPFSGTITTEKTPTVALIKPDGKTLEAFGYEAEDRFKDLIDDGKHENYYYFQRFKMLLHNKLGEELDRTIKLMDIHGRTLPALDIFAMSIKYLKEDMQNYLQNRVAGVVGEKEITWVITVPAIWSDGAKQFMREAAVKAGVDNEDLIIALEPEAASLYCRQLSVDTTADTKAVTISTFPEGTKYIVLDAGGGTIDITVHAVISAGLREIKAASGGGWGGTMVDKAFETLLTDDLFGPEAYNRFKKEETEDWLDLWRDFEMKKCMVKADKGSKIHMKFPSSLLSIFEEEKGQQFSSEVGASTKFAKEITFAGDKTKFEPSIFRNLFQESIKRTVDHLQTLREGTGIRAILMVGGYSESPMLQHAVKSTFKDLEIVIPNGASSAILRGALVYGHSPYLIRERVLKNTYGINCYRNFVHGVDDKSRLEQTDSGEKCKHSFKKYTERGQTVKLGQIQTHSFTPVNRNQKSLSFSMYTSKLKNPSYTDQGCTYEGKMNVELEDHDGDLSRGVTVSLKFSGTEVEVEGVDSKTGKKTNASLNFLG